MNTEVTAKLRAAFQKGKLRARSVSPEGSPEWRPILAAHRAKVPKGFPNVEVSTSYGSMILTRNHRVFVSPTEKVEAGEISTTTFALSESGGLLPLQVKPAPYQPFMYDLTVDRWHNFVVWDTRVVVSNSPDRNYRFRPPEGEGRVGCYNQVNGYIWTDEEFEQFLQMALWKWNLVPPRTDNYSTIEQVCQQRPSWQAALLWGALVTAAQALAYNWVADDFSVSPDTLVTVVLPDGTETSLSIAELYKICKESA